MCIVVCLTIVKHLKKSIMGSYLMCYYLEILILALVRIIVNGYIRQKAHVSWGSYTTQYLIFVTG